MYSSPQAFSRTTGVVTILVGGAVLIGWFFDIAALKTVFPGTPLMVPNTAIGLVLLGLSLRLLCNDTAEQSRKHRLQILAGVLAVTATLIGLMTLSEYVFGWDLGIDRLLLPKTARAAIAMAGRPYSLTALNLVLTGTALLFLDVETRGGHWPAQFCALAAGLVAFRSLIGYLYAIGALYRISPFTGMALHTSLAFLVLSSGVIAARPGRGLLATVTSQTSGGLLARWLLPTVVVILSLLGWLTLAGQHAGFYDVAYRLSLFVLLSITVLVVLIFWSASLLARTDMKRQRTEAALRASEERTRLIVEMAYDALISIDADGVITDWNPTAERIFGWSRAEALGRLLADLIIPALYREAHRRGLKHFLATGEGPVLNKQIEVTALHRDGHEFPVELSITPLRLGETYVFNAFLRDITERKQAEQLLRQRSAELEASNRELEAFTYSVSHDLRAPVRRIDGFSRILVEEFGSHLDATAQHYLQRIQEGTRQMGLLIDDLLNLSRIGRQEVKRELTGLQSLVDSVLTDLKVETAGRQVEWRLGELPLVQCDPRLMKQVLANLLSNALKFTRPRERAVIEVGQTTMDGEPAVFVRDNGVGFSMKYADKLFGIFQRLHRAEDFEGTGVGLATVQRIIHKHGWRVWAEAELDQGATFYFTVAAPEIADSRKLTAPGAERGLR